MKSIVRYSGGWDFVPPLGDVPPRNLTSYPSPFGVDQPSRPRQGSAMYTIAKRFAFSAAHAIGGLPGHHPCARLHGHNYEVEVELQSATLDSIGFVRDYRELSMLKEYIDKNLDHRHLNEVLGHDRTTSEVIAKWIYDWCKARWPEVAAVRVSETPQTWAEYRP